jgi:hypothetical protein
MVDMIDENTSQYIFLDEETNSKFRFKQNDKSENLGIFYYSKTTKAQASLGTVTRSHDLNEVSSVIVNFFELTSDEKEFIDRCKSVYGKRHRFESIKQLTIDEKEFLLSALDDYRNGVGH